MKKYVQLLYIAAIVTAIGCTGDKALFDELAGSRVTMIIKGTFESTSDSASIRNWNTAVSPQSIDDSVNDFITDASESFPTRFMVDIAEVRLAKADGSSDDKVGNYRQVFTASVNDNDPLFNGQGVRLKCDDLVPGKRYGMIKLYIRKLVFDNGTQWHTDANGNVVQGNDPRVIFHEKTVDGFDFNQLLVNSYYDSLKQNSEEVNRVFPLVIPIDGGLVVDEDDEVVIEIRLILKNFIKLYEYDFFNDQGLRAAYHYWAVSDWLRQVGYDEDYIGGNLLGVARAYIKNTLATVSGSTAGNGYVIAIPATDMFGNPQTIADYFLDDDNPDWQRPTQYMPAAPSLKNVAVESFLDYYLRHEQYKVAYNAFVDAVEGGTYETPWNSYDGFKGSLRLPPLVAYSSVSYTLTNVAHGQYLFYFVPVGSVPYGTLPQELADFTPLAGNPVTINGNAIVNF